jgi:hypothetical protein
MKGTIQFRYDKVHDIHIARAKWTIETEEDCKVWAQQFVEYFTPLDKRVDVIFDCDEFRIGKGIGSVWGRYRADINNRFTRFTVRVYVDARVATFTATSAALHNSVADEAPDIASAVQLIEEKRRRAL